MRLRLFLAGLLFAAVAVLPLGSASSAQAESGAHRTPPPPPIHVDVLDQDPS